MDACPLKYSEPPLNMAEGLFDDSDTDMVWTLCIVCDRQMVFVGERPPICTKCKEKNNAMVRKEGKDEPIEVLPSTARGSTTEAIERDDPSRSNQGIAWANPPIVQQSSQARRDSGRGACCAGGCQQVCTGDATSASQRPLPLREQVEVQKVSWRTRLRSVWQFITCCMWSDAILHLPIAKPGIDPKQTQWTCERCKRIWS